MKDMRAAEVEKRQQHQRDDATLSCPPCMLISLVTQVENDNNQASYFTKAVTSRESRLTAAKDTQVLSGRSTRPCSHRPIVAATKHRPIVAATRAAKHRAAPATETVVFSAPVGPQHPEVLHLRWWDAAGESEGEVRGPEIEAGGPVAAAAVALAVVCRW